MAHSLKIIYGGSTVDLNGGTIRMMEQYVPRCGDGNYAYDGVQFEISGTAVSVINEAVASMTKAMTQAVRYNGDRVGDRVYLSFQPDGYTSAYQSELVPTNDNEWKIEWDSDTMSAGRWSNGKTIQGYLTWKRRDYWQGAAVQLDLDNGNGTDNTSGLNVYNCNDGSGASPNKRNNYFDVDGADIINADLPCPVKIQLTNSTGSSMNMGSLWLGCNSHGKLSTYDDLSGTSDSAASGGAFYRLALSSTYANCFGNIFAGEIYTNHGNRSLGVLTRFNAIPPANTSGYLKMEYIQYQSDVFLFDTSTKLQLLGVFSSRATGDAPDDMHFYAKNNGGGNLDIDYWAVLPMNNYMRGVANQTTLGNGAWFYLDSSLIGVSSALWSSNATPVTLYYPTYGAGIYLTPNKDHRLTLHWDTTTGDCEITKYLTVKLWYYPRRRTL